MPIPSTARRGQDSQDPTHRSASLLLTASQGPHGQVGVWTLLYQPAADGDFEL
jgi:hypothetical protein